MENEAAKPIIDVAPSYDLMVCGRLIAAPPKRGPWSGWALERQQQMPVGEWQTLRRWFGGSAHLGHAYLAVIPRMEPKHDTAAFLDALARLPIADFLRVALTAGWVAPDMPLADADILALVGDRPAAERFLSSYARLSGQERRTMLSLLEDPQAARAELVTVLHQVAERDFAPLAPQLDAKRTEAAERLAERLAAGEQPEVWLEGSTSLAECAPVVIAPSVLLTHRVSTYTHEITRSLLSGEQYEPFIILVNAQWTLTAASARGRWAGGRASNSTEEWATLHAALADPSRLRLLRLLAQRPWYGQELATQLGMSAATISHHLNMLTNAGLISMERRAHRTYVVLHAERLRARLHASADFILSENASSPPERV